MKTLAAVVVAMALAGDRASAQAPRADSTRAWFPPNIGIGSDVRLTTPTGRRAGRLVQMYADTAWLALRTAGRDDPAAGVALRDVTRLEVPHRDRAMSALLGAVVMGATGYLGPYGRKGDARSGYAVSSAAIGAGLGLAFPLISWAPMPFGYRTPR